jgi:predicted esterase
VVRFLAPIWLVFWAGQAWGAVGGADKGDQALMQGQAIEAKASIFGGEKFPAIDFVDKDLVRRALGSYSFAVRYFDAEWREVKQPGAPGRYGALVEVRFPSGIWDRRELTLFDVGKSYAPAKDPYRASIQFPQAFGLPANIGATEAWNVEMDLNSVFEQAGRRDDAAFVASLHDIAADPVRFRGFETTRVNDMWWQELEKRQGLEVPYRKMVRLPEGYAQAPGKKWPLILFLHGSGQRGDDLAKLKGWGPAGYADQGHPLPCIVVTPQCLRRARWNPELLVKMLDEVEKTYRVDPSRLYLTGLSMGGVGVVDLAATYPGKFAALACLSGREDPDIAPRLHQIPCWFFHGADDEVVPARYSVALAAALKAAGGPVKVTLLPGVGHGDWDKVYAKPELYAWMMGYRLR